MSGAAAIRSELVEAARLIRAGADFSISGRDFSVNGKSIPLADDPETFDREFAYVYAAMDDAEADSMISLPEASRG